VAGKLYIVATPIGNLEDITLRALRVLNEVSLIAAEDTRVTRKLLSRYDIHTPLTAYHQHSEGAKARELADIIERGADVALVSDAGTPGISDPGHELIADAIGRGVEVVPIPGPNAIITALVISGLRTTRFAFDGFPPRKESERKAFFRALRPEHRTIVLYESPRRLVATFKSVLAEIGDRRVAVVREATKLFEEVFRGLMSEAIAHYSLSKPRGEVCVVIEGAPDTDTVEPDALAVEERLRRLMEQGVTQRDAVRQVAAETKQPRQRVYAAMLRLKEEKP